MTSKQAQQKTITVFYFIALIAVWSFALFAAYTSDQRIYKPIYEARHQAR